MLGSRARVPRPCRRLALALPSRGPAPNLKGRLLERAAAAIPPTPPLAIHPVETAYHRYPRTLERSARNGTTSAPLPLPGRRRPFWSLSWANLSGAIAAAVAVLAIWWALTLQARVDALATQNVQLLARSERYDIVVRVLSAPNFEQRDLNPQGAVPAWGRVYFDSDGGQGMVMVHDLPTPPEGTTYQVWLTRGNDRVSAGTFRTDGGGFGYTIVRADNPVGNYQRLGITQEPAPGSPSPTGPPILRGDL